MSTKINFPSLTEATGTDTGAALEGSTAVASTGVFTVEGINGETVIPECTRNGSDWYPLEVFSVGDSGTALVAIVADGIYRGDMTGLAKARTRVSVGGSGSVTTTITIVEG